MTHFNFDMAAEFARIRLESRLPRYLHYHSAVHTIQDVVPAVKQITLDEGVGGSERLLVLTAAWFHDLGYIHIHGDTTAEYKTRTSHHEEASAAIAQQVLPDFGYAPEEIVTITGAIMATKIPQTPHNLLEQIVADADLDSLGRSDFWKVSARLRKELAAFGMPSDESSWYETQLKFLKSHTYFTQSAWTRRQPGKEQNMAELRQRLEALKKGAAEPQSLPSRA